MELRLLGPVELYADGRVWDTGPPQQRHTLAALAVDAGRPVTTETLVDRVWDEAPSGARRTLQVHITRIRRLLERAGGGGDGGGDVPPRLVRRSGGYLLDVDPESVDLHRFQRLTQAARMPTTPDAIPLTLLREARALWGGEPLAGLPGHWAAQSRQVWRQQYLDATVAWAQAEIRSGAPDAVIGPLGDLTGEFPLVESLAAALLRALCAAGRPAEALERYATIRHRLVAELGADPSAELQAVYQAILHGELVPSGVGGTTAPAVVVAAQLPADVPGFAGRGEYLARLDALVADMVARPSTAVVISAVSGTAGVGKTALAVHWGHTARDRFPDGQLYVNLRGFDPGGQVTAPTQALRGFLDALGVPTERMPATVDAQAALYRSLLAGRRILVVLDNARDAEHVRPLLPGTPTVLALVTSRNQLTGLLATEGAHSLTLDVLSPREARNLLTQRLGGDRVAAEPEAVMDIIAACARLPLALTIAAAQARQTDFPLATIAAQLGTAGQRLDALDAGDPASQVRAVFSWSTAALTPAAAALFRLLGLHAGPDISIAAAASLAGEPVAESRRRLRELTRANLLVEHAPGRYTFHDLLRAYATDLTTTHDPEPTRQDAVRRLFDHYAHTAHTAARLLNPTLDPITLPLTELATGATPEHLADYKAAVAWLAAEHPVLLSTLRHTADTGFDSHAWPLACALHTFLGWTGQWHDVAATWQAALDAATRLGDRAARAYAHRSLASAVTRLDRHAEAHTHFRHALDLYTEATDAIGQAQTHLSLSYLWERQGYPELALDQAQRTLALCRAAEDRGGQADALCTVGWYQAQLGDHAGAVTSCEQALTLHEQLSDPYGQAATWDSLGYAHHHLGHYIEAIDCYQKSIALTRDLGSRYHEAATLSQLGDTYLAVEDPVAARAAWTHARIILTELGHPDAAQVGAKLAALNEHAATPAIAGSASRH